MSGAKMKMNYSKKKLMKALKSIKEGKYKICQASRIFNIPRQTLADKITGRRPAGYVKPGPQAVLGTEVENKIEEWLIENARLGFPLNREGLRYSVKHILDRIPEIVRSSIPFKNNTPGKGWFKSFRKRHPQVAIEYSDLANKNKHFPTNEDLKEWFTNVRKILVDKGCLDSLQDPRRIYAMNEFVVALSQDGSLRSIEKKTSPTLAAKCYDEKTFTLFLASNASGELAPPIVITKDEKILDSFSNISDKWGVVFSESCLISCEMFHTYVSEVFHDHLKSKQVTFPVTIFLNENSSCTSLPLTEFCEENGILTLAIPKYFYKFLNPLDVTTIFPHDHCIQKYRWKDEYDDVAHHPLISLIDDLLSNVKFENLIAEKFSSCGLFPFICNFDNDSIEEQNLKDKSSSKNQIMKYYESKIPPQILEEFKNCQSFNVPWNGCTKYAALFDFWSRADKDLGSSNKSVNFCQESKHTQLICLQSNKNLDDFIVEEEIDIY